MHVSLRDAGYLTILYADMFDYALTDREAFLWRVYIRQKNKTFISHPQCSRVRHGDATYMTLKRRTSLVTLRRRSTAWASHKWIIARHVAHILKWIPTIELVGVSGGLAMDNVKKNDDIDFYIVVSPGTVWVSRLLIAIALELAGRRRKRNQTQVHDLICANMIVGSDALQLPEEEQDLFGAHEVLQMQPIWDRGNVYKKFLQKNTWTKKFLPNAWKVKLQATSTKQRTQLIRQNVLFDPLNFRNCLGFVIWCLRFAESFSRWVQLWYMHRHATKELLTPSVIRFHPRDMREFVKQKLQKHWKNHNVPLDKIFYGN